MTGTAQHEMPVALSDVQVIDGLPGVILRRLRPPEDYLAMAAAYNRSVAADAIEVVATAQDVAAFYEHPENIDPAKDVLVVEAPEGVIGYVRTQWREEPLNGLRLYMHTAVLVPEWRGKGIGSAQLRAAEARLRSIAAEHPAEKAKVFQVYLADTHVDARNLLSRHGYQAARYNYLMVRPTLDEVPDLPLPAGLEVRPALPAQYRQIWDANNEAFRDHWGYVPMGEEDYRRWVNGSAFDPSLWRVAWDGEQVAGMVLAFVNAAENAEYNRRRGYTEDICVRRPWRRKGLARALIARSLRALRARGMAEAALGVDTENLDGALNLYESLGYRAVKRWAMMRKPLELDAEPDR